MTVRGNVDKYGSSDAALRTRNPVGDALERVRTRLRLPGATA